MDSIVRRHLEDHPSEERYLRPFMHDFAPTNPKRVPGHGSSLSLYQLKPSSAMGADMGLSADVLLAISSSRNLYQRLFQDVEKTVRNDYGGKVNQRVFFLVTKHANAKAWLNRYVIDVPIECMPVIFVADDLAQNQDDPWFIKNEIMSQLYTRDLFNVQLPINSVSGFFGRGSLITDFVQSISENRNRGLFGLRKTGKTSFLRQVERKAKKDKSEVIYFDCKHPAIRNSGWKSFLSRICDEIKKIIKTPLDKGLDARHISDQFLDLLKKTPRYKSICLIFDEIEYISPNAKMDLHWRKDFVSFGQTLWTAQSQFRRLSFIVAGVNPTVVETALVDGVQNPMFSISDHNYLLGLEKDELAIMIRYIGERMGLRFSNEAIEYMFARYGGHPLLTRMACSHVHKEIEFDNRRRPFEISARFLRDGEDRREEDLLYYGDHVVSELRQFYPDEYSQFETLASGNVAEFIEFSKILPESTRHLEKYGLIEKDQVGKPRIVMPVLEKYILVELARVDGTNVKRYITPDEQRPSWLEYRLQAIRNELRRLSDICRSRDLPLLYGRRGFANEERFLDLTVVKDKEDFTHFILTCDQCLREALIPKDLERDKSVKKTFPDYCDALTRIQAYRTNVAHLRLTPKAQESLQTYIERDLEGLAFEEVADVYFILQQSVIDNLYSSVIYEINRHS